ncbi:MAG: hypothetical protein ABF322_06120 [Lentimonas sp.]
MPDCRHAINVRGDITQHHPDVYLLEQVVRAFFGGQYSVIAAETPKRIEPSTVATERTSPFFYRIPP